MNWRLILTLMLPGVLFAALTIVGWIHGWESQVGLGLLTLVALVIAMRGPDRTVVHGLVAGFLTALAAIELQALFLPIYFANNPGYAEIEIPFGLPARMATAVLGPVNAVVAGIITATLTGLFLKLVRFLKLVTIPGETRLPSVDTSTTAQPRPARRKRADDVQSRILHWTQVLLRVGIALNFAFFGSVKLLDRAGSTITAQSFGFPGWSWFVIGTIEILAALALLIRPAAGLAASTLTIIMLGAVATHLWNDVPVRIPLRLLAFLGGLLIVWAMERRRAG